MTDLVTPTTRRPDELANKRINENGGMLKWQMLNFLVENKFP
jgi:hypothetical protein